MKGKKSNMMKLSFIPLFLATLAMAGCASVPLEPGAKKINITTDANAVIGCQYVGKVVSRTNAPYQQSPGDINRNEINAIKNAALTLGANQVVLTYGKASIPNVENTNNVHVIIGEAYVCPQAN